MSVPVRVAVFGSCLTRDVFNRRFSPHYRDLFDCVLLANQTSVISEMSPPVDVTGADLSGIDEPGQAEVRADLTRSFLTDLERLQPDYLVLDWFADVHFGCARLDGGIVTRNRWKIAKTPFYEQTWQADLRPRGREYREQWNEAARQLVAHVRTTSPGTRLVLHAARNATSVRRRGGEVERFGNAERLERMNRWWGRLNADFAPLADAVIDIFTDETISFDEHPWGPFAVHYELDYHAAFLSKLTAIALGDALAAAAPEPAARRGLRWGRPQGRSARASLGSR